MKLSDVGIIDFVFLDRKPVEIPAPYIVKLSTEIWNCQPHDWNFCETQQVDNSPFDAGKLHHYREQQTIKLKSSVPFLLIGSSANH